MPQYCGKKNPLKKFATKINNHIFIVNKIPQKKYE